MPQELHGAIARAIGPGELTVERRDELLLRLWRWQMGRLPQLGAVTDALGFSRSPQSVEEACPLPTDAFRYARISCFGEEHDIRVFRTSGTSVGARGSHFFRTLGFYHRAARTAADDALALGPGTHRLVMMAPSPERAPESSLSHMLGCFSQWYGPDVVWLWDGKLCLDALRSALDGTTKPVALMGTSFAFVHALDGWASRGDWFSLSSGSVLMHTGGLKGRSREVNLNDLERDLCARLDLEDGAIVREYGMTELSSQMYDSRRLHAGMERHYRAPPWVRVDVVDPQTLCPSPEGSPGLVRVDDLANVDSACCILTGDWGERRGGGFVLHGRAPGTHLRGCSLAVEEALAGDGVAIP